MLCIMSLSSRPTISCPHPCSGNVAWERYGQVSPSCIQRSSSYGLLSFQERLTAPRFSVSSEGLAQSLELPLLLLLSEVPSEFEHPPGALALDCSVFGELLKHPWEPT